MLSFYIQDWLQLIFRWVHVIAGIMWIGQTYLFNWMETRFAEWLKENSKENCAGELWMVHGGGFYWVEKIKTPKKMPQKLHWFKWESAFTWLTGIGLLIMVYYMGGLLLEQDSPLSQTTAIAIGVGSLIGAWLVYSLILTKLLDKNIYLGGLVSFILTMAAAYGLDQIFSARAMYIHIAAMFGTIMVANVWMRIMPFQKQIVDATERGETPDMEMGKRAKNCSMHNSFLSVPVIFLMISNHYAVTTYGSAHNLIILGCLILGGWVAAHFIRKW